MLYMDFQMRAIELAAPFLEGIGVKGVAFRPYFA